MQRIKRFFFLVVILLGCALSLAAVLAPRNDVRAERNVRDVSPDAGDGSAQYLARSASMTGTPLSGDIVTNTTLTLANSPYTLTDMITVQSRVTLTVEPGVVIEGAANSGLYVFGVLHAVGTAELPILFTGVTKQAGSWGGLVGYSSDPTAPSIIHLEYTTLEYGGAFMEPIYTVYNSQLILRHCTIQNNGYGGVYHGSLYSELIATDTAILNNAGTALLLDGEGDQDPILARLTATGNENNAVVYNSLDFKGDLIMEVTGLPTNIHNSASIGPEGSLTVQPGITLTMDAGFYIYGNFTALGTITQPITFTGAESIPGSWNGLYIAGNEDAPVYATLDHVVIEYGGTDYNSASGNIEVENTHLTVKNSTIRYSLTNGVSTHGAYQAADSKTVLQNVNFVDNNTSAVLCFNMNCNFALSDLLASGNGWNTLTYDDVIISATEIWADAGLEYLVEGAVSVASTASLVITPGVKVNFARGASLQVGGALLASGTQALPIIFTGSTPQSGWWNDITVTAGDTSGVMELDWCEIGYGGGSTDYAPALVRLLSPAASIQHCYLHHSASAAVVVDSTGSPLINYNRIEDNFAGVTNMGYDLVDARYNWWGDASGPAHSSNPTGVGDSVSDDVNYQPWLTDPGQIEQSNELEVQILGPSTFSPGSTQVYSIRYYNGLSTPVEDAVLRLALPTYAVYLSDTANGVHYPEQHQLFWKLGDLTPGASGVIAIHVRFEWGLPTGLKDAVVAQLSGANLPLPPFDVTPYLEYQSKAVTGRVELTAQQIAAERAADNVLDQFIQTSLGQGFTLTYAVYQTLANGAEQTVFFLLKSQPEFKFRTIYKNLDGVIAETLDAASLTVGGEFLAVRYSLQTGDWEMVEPVQAAGVPGALAPTMSWAECMKNCVEEKLPEVLLTKKVKALGTAMTVLGCIKARSGDTDALLECSKVIEKAIPGYGDAVDLGKCNYDCQRCVENGQDCNDDNCHCCKKDKYRCDNGDWLYGFFGIATIKRTQCYNDKYLAETVVQVCALCEKCVDMEGSGPACVSKNASSDRLYTSALAGLHLTSGDDSQCSECQPAHDPNEMYGPSGDLLPGQLLTYTIAYENMGAGEAYSVFIVNRLNEHFDLDTLQILSGAATLSRANATLYFLVGDLPTGGEPGASGAVTYTVQLKNGLASGTVIQNQAVVHFPSAAEETPTNPVVNVIAPVRVDSLALTTTGTAPVTFTLTGQEAAGLPLTFTIQQLPLRGILSGAAPYFTYTAGVGVSGIDLVTFLASNGISESNLGEVVITVLPDPNETVAPEVWFVAPAQGQNVWVSPAPLVGETSWVYNPVIQVQFSEAINPATLTSSTVVVERGVNTVPAELKLDGTTTQLLIRLKTMPVDGETYTVRLTPGVQDLAGNGLSAEVSWSFILRLTEQPHWQLFLPVVLKQ